MEKSGFIQHVAFGENIEVPLDYRRNPDTAVLVADQDTASLVKTEILTSAVYDIAQLNVPVSWSKGDEVKNPTETQKVALVKQLLENGINSHDDEIEIRIFTSSSAGGIEINGLNDLINTATTGTVGGIDSSVETWWGNKAEQYVDGSDIEAAATELFNACAKGSGSSNQPTMIVSGADTQALFMSQMQSMQRFVDAEEANVGFKVLSFMGAKWIYSHKGGANAYFLNPKNYNIVVSKHAFRDKGDQETIQGQNAFYFMIYSALQCVVSNRSRLGVLYT